MSAALCRDAATVRRRTLFPLSAVEVHRARVDLAHLLHGTGHSFRSIRQVLNLSGPEEARKLVAKGARVRKRDV